jgi:hypothetical protein
MRDPIVITMKTDLTGPNDCALEASCRLFLALEQAGIKTIGDILNICLCDPKQIQHRMKPKVKKYYFGIKTAKELHELLTELIILGYY